MHRIIEVNNHQNKFQANRPLQLQLEHFQMYSFILYTKFPNEVVFHKFYL